jgi:hypothetical protein
MRSRRVDPQVQVGLLVDPSGSRWRSICSRGTRPRPPTLLPVLRTFQERHGVTGMVVVADARMLSANNLNAIEDAGFSFIVGSRITKAPTTWCRRTPWCAELGTDKRAEATGRVCWLRRVIAGRGARHGGLIVVAGVAVVLGAERWLDLRRFQVLRESGASIAEIARETGLNWRTVRKYLEGDAPAAPPVAASRPDVRIQLVAPVAPLIDARLRAEILLKGTVIYERLVADYGFTGSYQRIKLYLHPAQLECAQRRGQGVVVDGRGAHWLSGPAHGVRPSGVVGGGVLDGGSSAGVPAC